MLAGYLGWFYWTYEQIGLRKVLMDGNSFMCRGLTVLKLTWEIVIITFPQHFIMKKKYKKSWKSGPMNTQIPTT